jgi:hypothetical protein
MHKYLIIFILLLFFILLEKLHRQMKLKCMTCYNHCLEGLKVIAAKTPGKRLPKLAIAISYCFRQTAIANSDS